MTGGSRAALLALLADGELHSGPSLAARLGTTRAAVWKLVAELRRLGVDVVSEDRRGYRLRQACELLEARRIRAAAAGTGEALPGELEVLFSIDSTNDYLYTSQAVLAGHPRIVFAEIQLAGRGRRGRSWLAPFGSGLTFSIGWTYPDLPADLSALSLAMGVQVADALREAGAAETMLKWPNDIVWRHRKLGGLLIQLKLEAGGAASVVVGLGLNVALPADARESLATSGAAPSPICARHSAAIRRAAMRWPVAWPRHSAMASIDSGARASRRSRAVSASSTRWPARRSASRRRRAASRAGRSAPIVTVRCA